MLDVERSTFASGSASAIFCVPMNLLITVLLVLFVLVSGLMVLVILMQRPKSEGLGAAFGGGVTENIFGAQTTNVLVKFRSEEHTSELQSHSDLVCRLLLEKKKEKIITI